MSSFHLWQVYSIAFDGNLGRHVAATARDVFVRAEKIGCGNGLVEVFRHLHDTLAWRNHPAVMFSLKDL